MQILLIVMNFAFFFLFLFFFFFFFVFILYFTHDLYPLTIGPTTFNCTLMSNDKAHAFLLSKCNAWLPAQLAPRHAWKWSAASV